MAVMRSFGNLIEMKVVPERIFKYSKLDNNLLKNLVNGQLYFNHPVNLNDPFDCFLPTVFRSIPSIEVEEEKSKLPETVDMSNEECEELYIKSIEQSLNVLKKDFINKSGITCFTECNKNLLMWSHYADSHKGVCLEFIPKGSFFKNFKKVRYLEEIPQINWIRFINSEFTIEDVETFWTSKSIEWSYENEWRLFIKLGGRVRSYHSNSLQAIYFGYRTGESDIKMIKNLKLGINLYKAELDDNQFKIKFRKLET